MLYSLQYFQQMYDPEKTTWNLQHLENSLSYNREWKPSRNWVRDYLSYDCCTVRSVVYVSTMVRKCGTFIFFVILWRNEREQTYELEVNGSRDWTSRLWQRTSAASSDPARSRSTDIFTVCPVSIPSIVRVAYWNTVHCVYTGYDCFSCK